MKRSTREALGLAAVVVATFVNPEAGAVIEEVRQAGRAARERKAGKGVVIDVAPGSYRVR